MFELMLILACLCFASSQAEDLNLIPAQEINQNSQMVASFEKIYVKPSQIYFLNNQILVATKKGLLPINSLETDAIGVYYKAAHPYHWVCSTCGTYNTYTYFCETCGKAPKDAS
jgi:hypothetical protein